MWAKIKELLSKAWAWIVVLAGLVIGVIYAVVTSLPKKQTPHPVDPVSEAHKRDAYDDLQEQIRVAEEVQLKALERLENARKQREATQRIERDTALRHDAENQSSNALKESLMKEVDDALKK